MKTMTCRQFGGPCDTKITGNSVDEIQSNAKAHMHSIHDEGHEKTIAMIRGLKNNPDAQKKWNDDFTANYNAAPEE